MSQSQKIAIIGAGIGGLTTALALRMHGFDVKVYEQSQQLGEVGAGLTISPNAARVFNALGLQERFEALDAPMPHIGTLAWDSGKRLTYEERDLGEHQQQLGALTRQVHRADLHAMLAEALGAGFVQTGHKLSRIKEEPESVLLDFTNGNHAQADYVIACDGLKSIVRTQHFSASAPSFTGFVAWRGLVPHEAVPDIELKPHFATYPAPDKLFVRYPVRGGSLVNYVAIARKPDFTAESWGIVADATELMAEFANWHADVGKLIQATPEGRCMCWALYTRPLLESWTTARVGLLGDAAHPMTPFFGMGAAMAIEDGFVLARCFEAESEDLASGLKRYEAARLPRGNLMQKMSLQRAEAYMHPEAAQRNQKPSAGLNGMLAYDPTTVPI